jgi:hypothetical protein
MENGIPKVIEADIEWEDRVTDGGKKYQVGYQKGDGQLQTKTDLVLSPFGIAVNWPVAGKGWIATTPTVQQRAKITECQLFEANTVWRYSLNFVNTAHYNYFFYDETGDYYQVNTFRNGTHYVAYDSDKPTIAYIRGK